MPIGFTYILLCNDGSLYTGSTTNLEVRIAQHKDGVGAKHTAKNLPVILVYSEEYQRIDDAFYREKQIQGWTKAKKRALIEGRIKDLKYLAECKNITRYVHKE